MDLNQAVTRYKQIMNAVDGLEGQALRQAVTEILYLGRTIVRLDPMFDWTGLRAELGIGPLPPATAEEVERFHATLPFMDATIRRQAAADLGPACECYGRKALKPIKPHLHAPTCPVYQVGR